MSVGMVLFLIVLLLFFGLLPQSGFYRGGYQVSSVLGTVLLVLVILYLMGRL